MGGNRTYATYMTYYVSLSVLSQEVLLLNLLALALRPGLNRSVARRGSKDSISNRRFEIRDSLL